MPSLSVIDQQLLQAIDTQGLAACAAFERHEDVWLIWSERTPLVVKIAAERLKRQRINIDGSGLAAFAVPNMNGAIRTLDVVELNAERFADTEAADPHEQDQRAVAPGPHGTKECLELLCGDEI